MANIELGPYVTIGQLGRFKENADDLYASKGEVRSLKGSDISNDLGWQTAGQVTSAINSKIIGLMDYKGSVNAYSDLPANAETGDVYNVASEYQNNPAGTNYAWNGTSWDALGGEVDLSGYAEQSDIPANLTDLANDGNFVQDPVYVHVTAGDGLVEDEGKLSLGDVVTDSHDGPIYSAHGEGWAEQASTTGKNLLPNTATSQTVNGVTFTVNHDGSVTANGTSSDEVLFYIYRGTLQAGTYTMSALYGAGVGDADAYVQRTDVNPYAVIARDNSTSSPSTPTFTLENETSIRFAIRVRNGKTVNNLTFYSQLEAGSTATSYEPYTGGAPSPSPDYPQEIRMARGRNLLKLPTWEELVACETTGNYRNYPITAKPNTQYYLSTVYDDTGDPKHGGYILVSSNKTNTGWKSIAHASQGAVNGIITTDSDGMIYVNVFMSQLEYEYVLAHATSQLELGSTPTPYVPYGHVGLEVRNKPTQELVDIRAIPLPLKSDGERWAGGLSDGTSDILTLDSAGRYEWESVTEEVVLDGSSDENWSLSGNGARVNLNMTGQKRTATNLDVANAYATHFVATSDLNTYNAVLGFSIRHNDDYFSFSDGTGAMAVSDWKTWLASHNVTVLYPLATPVTEHGYIDLPDVPEGATIDIPELREVDVKCFLPSVRELAEHAANWAKRLDESIKALEARLDEMEG